MLHFSANCLVDYVYCLRELSLVGATTPPTTTTKPARRQHSAVVSLFFGQWQKSDNWTKKTRGPELDNRIHQPLALPPAAYKQHQQRSI